MTKLLLPLAAIGSVALMGCSSGSQGEAVAASSACSQLGDNRAEVEALLAPGNLQDARQVKETVFRARAIQNREPAGADLYMVAQKGVTAPYLERTLSCHAAGGAAIGRFDPFHPDSGQVTDVEARQTRAGYAVRVSGDSTSTNREIWERARTLTESSVTIEQLASAEEER